jgi:hypothetical protein
MIATLAHVVQVGLLAEAAEDFAKPMTSIKRTTLAVYLDAPVAMDLLNISGAEAFENIRLITERVKSLGGSVRIFDDSIEEIQRNLRAFFRRSPAQKTGPTATAVRKMQVLESYVREVLVQPIPALERAGVQVVSRSLEQFPSDHKYFDEECYREIYSQIQWHMEDVPRAHDALVVTNIMRMRRGQQTTDMFESGHISVTRNAILSRAARRISIERGKINRYSVGPVIHQRQLATAVWLRAGLDDGDKKTIPLHLLLAWCERVLQLRPDVVQKARHLAQARGPDTATQLDLLLTVDRSTQVLMQRTLNTASVVDESMFDDVLKSMRESLIAEKTAEFETNLEEARRQANEAKIALENHAAQKVAKLNNEVFQAQRDIGVKDDLINALSNEDDVALEALLAFINSEIDRKKRFAARIILSSALAVDLALAVLAIIYPSPTVAAFLVIAVLITAGHFIGKIQEFTGLGIITRETAEAMLWVEATKRAIDPKLRRVQLAFVDQYFIRQT